VRSPSRRDEKPAKIRAGDPVLVAMPEKRKFSKADHEFSGFYSSLTRPGGSPRRRIGNGIACRVLATARHELSPCMDFTLPRGRAVWHNERNFSTSLRRFRRQASKGGFLANFIR
jgi:hypothetical protein